jgi:hypothetical protein
VSSSRVSRRVPPLAHVEHTTPQATWNKQETPKAFYLPDALVGLMSCGGARLHCRTCHSARASLMVADMLLIGSQRCWFLSSVFLMVGGIVVDAEMMSLGGIVVRELRTASRLTPARRGRSDSASDRETDRETDERRGASEQRDC